MNVGEWESIITHQEVNRGFDLLLLPWKVGEFERHSDLDTAGARPCGGLQQDCRPVVLGVPRGSCTDTVGQWLVGGGARGGRPGLQIHGHAALCCHLDAVDARHWIAHVLSILAEDVHLYVREGMAFY